MTMDAPGALPRLPRRSAATLATARRRLQVRARARARARLAGARLAREQDADFVSVLVYPCSGYEGVGAGTGRSIVLWSYETV